jgi:hypothetical protein
MKTSDAVNYKHKPQIRGMPAFLHAISASRGHHLCFLTSLFTHNVLSCYAGTQNMVGLEDIALGRWVRCDCTLSICSLSSSATARKTKATELGMI